MDVAPSTHKRVQETSDKIGKGKEPSRQYCLKSKNKSGVMRSSTYVSASTAEEAKRSFASHLDIGFPITLSDFKSAGGISIHDPRGRKIFPPAGMH